MVARIFQMAKRFITDPQIRFGYLTRLGLFDSWTDEKFLDKKYHIVTGKRLNLEHPSSFNEKLQWLKIHDRKPVYTKMVDKYAVKDYVAERIGKEYIIPTLGVWDVFDDIDFGSLPDQFVLKCTHDSGGIYICEDKGKINLHDARRIINSSLKRNYYYEGREWPYKDVPPRIIAEKYLVDESGCELKDYKIFCFNGEPKLIQVDFGRFDVHKRNLYTTNWKYIDASIKYPNDPAAQIPRPERLERMLEIAGKLSKKMPYIRVDMYSIREKIYFSELTLYHGSGMERFTPEEFEYQMGDWMELKGNSLCKV